MKYFFRIYSKVNQVTNTSLQIHSPSFKALALIVLRYFADKVKCPKLQRAIIQEVFFKIYSKVYQVTLLITTSLFIKFQGSGSNSFWDILLKR